MANKPTLYDHYGRPLRKSELRKEVSAATVGGVRSPISGYPGTDLDPERLAGILRAADQGDGISYLELAETVEERDPHYLGVISTRRRSVSQIEITVEAGSDDPVHEEHAEEVRQWLKRDELTRELFNILDCIPKGFSFTEIIWDTSMGQWEPKRLERRDPRWFRFNRHDLTTPMRLDEHGQEKPLEGGQFIYAQIEAKSGLPLRSGLARLGIWGWLFKAYTSRDWAIFSQTYGQPLRVGKWGAGASEDDKHTLFRAVAGIAGDCAAIIPESMTIEFIETGNVSATGQLYMDRVEHLDKQISKAVLGQTATTDAETGGLGSGKEHREVQEDIERSDAASLAAILNRDLIYNYIQLNHGPQKCYPRIKIARPEPEDIKALSDSLAVLVPLGLRVRESEIREKLNLAEPEANDRILGQIAKTAPPAASAPPISNEITPESEFEYRLNTHEGHSGVTTALNASTALSGPEIAPSPDDLLADQLDEAAAPVIQAMIEQLETMMEAAGSLEELREMWLAAYPDLDAGAFAEVLADAMIAAEAGGRAEVADG